MLDTFSQFLHSQLNVADSEVDQVHVVIRDREKVGLVVANSFLHFPMKKLHHRRDFMQGTVDLIWYRQTQLGEPSMSPRR
jgi:hypothetical protein